MSRRTPLGKVRGLGSARSGTHHFWHQRVTSLILIPLTFWLVYSVLVLAPMDHAAVTAWMGAPLNALLLLIFLITAFYHAQLGVQVVIEDYIHVEWKKIACIILVNVLAILAGTASVLAVLKVFLGN